MYQSNYIADPFNDPFFQNARMSLLSQQPLFPPTQILNPQIQFPGIQNNFHSVFITPPEVPEDEEYSKALVEYEEQRDKLERMEKNILELHKQAVEKQKMRNSSYQQQQQIFTPQKQDNFSTQVNYDSKSLAKDFGNLKTPSQYQNMPYSKSTVNTDNSLNHSKNSLNNNQTSQFKGNMNFSNSKNQQPVQHSYGEFNNMKNSNQFLNVQQQQPQEIPQRSSFYESFEKVDTCINEKGEKVVTKKIETNQDGIRNTQVHEQIFNQQGQLLSDNIWNERPALENDANIEQNSRNNTLNAIPMETSNQYIRQI